MSHSEERIFRAEDCKHSPSRHRLGVRHSVLPFHDFMKSHDLCGQSTCRPCRNLFPTTPCMNLRKFYVSNRTWLPHSCLSLCEQTDSIRTGALDQGNIKPTNEHMICRNSHTSLRERYPKHLLERPTYPLDMRWSCCHVGDIELGTIRPSGDAWAILRDRSPSPRAHQRLEKPGSEAQPLFAVNIQISASAIKSGIAVVYRVAFWGKLYDTKSRKTRCSRPIIFEESSESFGPPSSRASGACFSCNLKRRYIRRKQM
jgi:hypothetical protein